MLDFEGLNEVIETPQLLAQGQKYEGNESLIAALKIMDIGEKDRMQGNGISSADSRTELAAARQRRE